MLKSNGKFLISLIVVMMAIIVLPGWQLMAQETGGGYAESWLLRDVGARPVAMGGAYSAIADDAFGLFYNPACLSQLDYVPVISASQTMMEYSRTQSTIVWGQSIIDEIGVGFGINNFTSGAFVGRDATGRKLGDLTSWQSEIVAGAAYRMEFVSFGVAAKYFSHALTGTHLRGDGYGVDLGANFNIMDLFSFGLSVQNASGMMFWTTDSDNSEQIPYTIRTGLAMEFALNEEEYVTRSTVTAELESVSVPATRYITVALDAIMTQHENAPSLLLGIEAVPHEKFAVRGGIALFGDNKNHYEFLPMTIWAAGFSIRPENADLNLDLPFDFTLDYTISSDYLAANKIAHHIALIFDIRGY